MSKFNTPGMYVQEIPKFPKQITVVETAIPAFIGYTEKAIDHKTDDQRFQPKKINSLLEYEQYFGYSEIEKGSSPQPVSPKGIKDKINFSLKENEKSKFLMHYSLQLYFANGGKACWIVSVGNYTDNNEILAEHLQIGLDHIASVPEVTLIVFPDSTNLATAKEYYNLHQSAIDQCSRLKNRLTILDVYHDKNNTNWESDIKLLRDLLNSPVDYLRYAAVYFPRIYASINVRTINSESNNLNLLNRLGLGKADRFIPKLIKKENFVQAEVLMPVSAALVGIYAQIDHRLGVWKAPVNVQITNAKRTEYLLTDNDQKDLNIDEHTGKSINCIRPFTGRGTAVVWGGRTLAGNDNEWRYINITRTVSTIKQSIINYTHHLVFENNDQKTWMTIKVMVENFLFQYWKMGALVGQKPEHAYFVKIGLGQTMTEADIVNKKMQLLIGLALIRPAEFIIIKINYNMEL